MTTSIGSVGDLVSVIRAQLSARTAPGAAPARGGAKARGATASRYADANLAALIETRVGHIDRDDPQRGRKAFRVFLEAVLLAQFGEGLVNDARFYQMTDEVQKALETDPHSAALVASAMEQLLAEKR